MTLQATKTAQDNISIEISSELSEGNMEILIMIDNQYYSHVPINQTSTINLSNISEIMVTVQLAAESAKLNVSVKRYV